MSKSVLKVIKKIQASFGQIEQNADMLDVFQQTMKVEKNSFDFYENALERCHNKNLQKIFKFFLESEKKYYYFLLTQFAN